MLTTVNRAADRVEMRVAEARVEGRPSALTCLDAGGAQQHEVDVERAFVGFRRRLSYARADGVVQFFLEVAHSLR
jgi:hypothetical protein